MPSDTQPAGASKIMFWAGVIVSALPALMLSMSAVMKLIRADVVLEQLNEFGWSENIVFAVGFVELACVVVYVVPQTAILGAILLTGYLGGAVAVHVRVSDSFIAPIVIGALVWLGLYLRDARVRVLIPLRR